MPHHASTKSTPAHSPHHRIGIDLGGTKIEGAVLGPTGLFAAKHRVAAPRGSAASTVAAIANLIEYLERAAGLPKGEATVGIGMPGSPSPVTGLVRNANSTWLNGTSLQHNIEQALSRPVRLANDANCFALSEATDGSGAGARIVFGVILGTGCGGGLVVDGKLLIGRHGIAGEWGHCPLPWATAAEHPGGQCWCGNHGCMETWVSGPALAADFTATTGETIPSEEIVERSDAGDAAARETLHRHASRLGRGLAMISNILDPDVIVLGGGLSKLAHLYRDLPQHMARYILSSEAQPVIKPPHWGDAGGVRGAAWLWP